MQGSSLLTYAIFVPSAEKLGELSLLSGVLVSFVFAEPLGFMVRMLPFRTNEILPFCPGNAACAGSSVATTAIPMARSIAATNDANKGTVLLTTITFLQ